MGFTTRPRRRTPGASPTSSSDRWWRPRTGRAVGLGLAVGFLLAVIWSYEFVDQVIGHNVASSLLGYDPEAGPGAEAVSGALFAFVVGLAGTFTACNVAAFCAVAPMVAEGRTRAARLRRALVPLGWLAVGMLAVSGAYGAVGVLMADQLPQLSTARTAGGMPVRVVQSSVVFGVIGVVLVYLGLTAAGAVPDALSGIRRRFRHVDVVVLGALIGAFLIGRPFGLFREMFADAAAKGDPLYGAATFMLQSLGNVVVLAVVFVLLVSGLGSGFRRWLARAPGRPAVVTAGTLVAAGSFTFFYWVLRVPSIFGYGWFPTAPWS